MSASTSTAATDTDRIVALLQVRLEELAAHLRTRGDDPLHVATCEASIRLLGGLADYRRGIDAAIDKVARLVS